MKLQNLALRWFSEQRYAETTEQTYMATVKSLERRFPLHVGRVTPSHLVDFLTLDADGSRTGRSPSTLGRQRTTLRCMFRWATRNGYVKTDPAADLDMLMLGSGKVRPGRWLTKEQAANLVASIDRTELRDHRDHVLIVTAMLTGLRRAELAALRWRDVDLDNGRIAVIGKGAKPAVIGVPRELSVALTDWRGRGSRESGGRSRPTCPVFPTGRTIGGGICERWYRMDWADHMCVSNVFQIVARRAEAADLGIVATHDLRRSFAGWLDEASVDLAGIQAALRHSSPGVTVACYLDPSPRRAVDAVRSLEIGFD